MYRESVFRDIFNEWVCEDGVRGGNWTEPICWLFLSARLGLVHELFELIQGEVCARAEKSNIVTQMSSSWDCKKGHHTIFNFYIYLHNVLSLTKYYFSVMT